VFGRQRRRGAGGGGLDDRGRGAGAAQAIDRRRDITQARDDDVQRRCRRRRKMADQAAAGADRQAPVGHQRRGADAVGQHHVVGIDRCAVADDAPAPVATFQPGHGEIEAAVDAVEQARQRLGGLIQPAPANHQPPIATGQPARAEASSRSTKRQ
jgi:hypothetical protein